MRRLPLAFLLLAFTGGGCSSGTTAPAGADGSALPGADGSVTVPVDGGARDTAVPGNPADLAGADLAGGGMMSGGGGGEKQPDGGGTPQADGGVFGTPDGGGFMPPPMNDPAMVHGAPAALPGLQTLLSGQGVADVSTDQGGGIWAVTAPKVYYFPPAKTQPVAYDQSNGLARGMTTWKDTYYSGTEQAPQSFPVAFSAVAGATAGQAIVGNVGAIADRLVVDPASGAVQKVENLKVTMAQSNGEEFPEHLKRVVATHKVIADLNGTLKGTAYLGGWHGFSAFHGLTADCGCLAFEEHQHFIPGAEFNYCDSSGEAAGCWDGDVWGLALAPNGDVWAGDRHFVQLLKQRSLGPNAGFFDDKATWAAAIDVFPGVRDEVHGLAVDKAGGVWVASEGNGLAYLSPGTYHPTYYTSATVLPMNRLHGVAIDPAGDVWVGTLSAGVARLQPASGKWTYYTAAGSGLPSDSINTVTVDAFSTNRRILIATTAGVAIYTGP